MAAPVILLEKGCHKQQADKSFVAGTLSVQEAQLSWTPAAGGDVIHIPWALYNGAKKAKEKPMLMFTGAQPLIIRFANLEDTEAVMKAVASAAAAAAGGADAGAAGGGVPAGAAAARSASPAASAAASAAGPPTGSSRGSAAPAAGGGAATAEQQQQQPRSGMPSAAERRKLLTENSLLLAQYETLVRGGTLTEEDFWCSPVYNRLLGRDTAGGGGPPQATGPSNQLPDITKMVVITNMKQANLRVTPELQRQIFAEKPLVAAAFRQEVPAKMNEMEFWERYFRYSRAMAKRRDNELRAIQRTQAPHTLQAGQGEEGNAQASNLDPAQDELFAPVAREAEGDGGALVKARKRRVNPAVDLDAHADDGWSEGYGLAHNAARSELDGVKGYKAVSRALVREYNTHALAVLKGSGVQLSSDGATAAASVAAGSVASSSTAAAKAAAAAAATGGVAGADASEEEVQRLYSGMGAGLEDLQQPVEQEFEELHVTDPRTYFTKSSSSGATDAAPATTSGAAPKKQRTQEPAAAAAPPPPPSPASVVQALRQVDPCRLPNPPMQPSVAARVGSELTHQCTAGEGGGVGSVATPQEVLQEATLAELRRRSMVVNEVMRHFWALIPVNTEAKKAKFAKLEAYIEREKRELEQLMKRTQSQETAAANKLLKPLDAQIKAAVVGVLNVKRAWKQKAAKEAAQAAGGEPMAVA